ncbi:MULTISPECIES: FAD-dependent oxidoreductase [Streptomyces]|uniref:Glycine/D-amino acid oxidase-like deaminating enzyme/nitrite reductase/ring-hydroxylating ferredoxin subunit n=2 Tax=Streptomyces stelliscabiei TaxID=146820 RepID=A0A8I0P143_9ACTN|nr:MULTISPECIES: FAD-dependent oxidoreductase [Streptomyces]KND45614.1 [Fe-S]-binding protein [Streptomyces stelliscabiei]MBE1597478.1 glycine/D-amino acid oxidase-like deaminating enzyme/nitrite reductase/ring-hydroxylating ferredoxin subunit [Streptomyces stelliscabiei]MDX2513596.1 FAD-dependent oxidoreductase [Streptomyces stelliscabiei]SOD77246.1 Glycine/D-amino acid oxidase [Streptomyces sp. 1222.2]
MQPEEHTQPQQRSYWIESAPHGSEHPALDGDLVVDVAVVGAGIAGISTAWELARRGRRVALLEADRVAAGVTGHTTAKVTALHTLIYDRLRRTRGAEAAALYARSQNEAVRHAAALVEELGIDCDWEDAAAYTYAEDEGRVAELRAEAEAAREAGLPAEFVTETGLPFPVAGAVRVADQAQFHPRKYLLALVGDLVRQGASVHERTRVVRLKEGSPCRLTTEAGFTVTAEDVVIATHYPVFDRALLFTRLSPRRELVLAAPAPAGADPHGMYITQEQRTRSARTAPYGDGRRLLIVTGEHFTPGTAGVEARFELLADWAAERFGPLDFTHRWATQDNDSTDSVPLVGLFHAGSRHTWVATGFGGWGMSGGIMAGRLLAGLITGHKSAWSDLYDPRRVLSAVREAPAFLKHQAQVARHFVGDRISPPGDASVDAIAPGDGAVVRVGGRHCAVHRDEDGSLHAVSARCTHMGCLVGFNRAERMWECPCHGSRFDVEGRIVQGPATKPLEGRDL